MNLKHVFRRLAHSPVFTAITLLTLAAGIGANTAIFSVINGILVKPLPYRDPDRLIGLWHTAPGLKIKQLNMCPANYFTYREDSRTLQQVAIWNRRSATVTGTAEPVQVGILYVSQDFFPLIGVEAVRGRSFSSDDDKPGAPETAMIAYSFWQSRFGGGPAVGQRILVDGRAREIIGVLPQSFRWAGDDRALVLPFQMDRSKAVIGQFNYTGVARLKPGATLAQANADVARMLTLMQSKFPPVAGLSLEMLNSARLAPTLHLLKEDVVGDIGRVLWVLMAVVGIVLLIACANVANLLLVRVEGRQQELAVRAALGAGWGRIARELLMESLTLGIAGGVLGTAVALGAVRALVAIAPAGLPRLNEIAIDPAALVFTFFLSIFTGLLFGLIPVLKYAGPQLATGLRSGGRNASHGRERHRARNVLVVVQVALALVLLVASGLMIRTVQALNGVDPGFRNPEKLLTMRISIPGAQVKEAERVARMHHDIAQKIATIPGVESVAMTSSVTMDGDDSNDPIFREDQPGDESKLPPIRRMKDIAPGYFATMGNRIMAGRDFTWTDIFDKRPMVLISDNLAREFWGSAQAAIGKRLREKPGGLWREVIGVAGDERDNGVDSEAPKIVYWPSMVDKKWSPTLRAERNLTYVIRSPRTGTEGFLTDVQQAVWSTNGNLPLAGVRTVAEIYRESMARTSFTLVMLSIAGGLALLLGVVGLYGVIAYSVTQRTREIGIRMALGAQHGRVQRMFVWRGLLLAGVGVVVGLAAALPLSRLMGALIYGISPLDPVTYGAVSLVLLAAALLATYIPARRATEVDPALALRAE